jgi:hypothetical protein
MNVEHKVAQLTPLEIAVIEAIAQGQPQAERQCLLEQLRQSELSSRKLTGYGFFTNFTIPDHVPGCSLVRELLASAFVDEQLCGFILWMSGGRIECLEGYPLGGDSWPENESFKSITLNS